MFLCGDEEAVDEMHRRMAGSQSVGEIIVHNSIDWGTCT